MKFLADFHIHSRFSRATAKNLDFENLYIAAQLKGITVVGTGDFTHPAWFSELTEKLVPAEEGLFKLKKDVAVHCDTSIPESCRKTVRFLLVTEISNIYKKNRKTRKNHNLVFMPDVESAVCFNSKLGSIGNIQSDGRPILGLDARDLLEIVLETSEQAFLIPAHIWTPWFSLLGSKSGFDSVQECFEDLTPHIFAVETGLSSDPGMNRRVSDLDGLTLVSNSDAHSPGNLGREANLFETSLSYDAIKEAVRSGNSETLKGTIEFYPEEGKYHLDGHRKCRVSLRPEETRKKNGICPVCEKPLTLGVLYRVEALADRPEGDVPEKYHPFFNLIPLSEILSELFRVGVKSKKVGRQYQTLLAKLGSEFDILQTLPISRIDAAGIPLLGEAIERMRNKNVYISAGYDGEYGRITLFEPGERERLEGQKSLFQIKPPAVSMQTPEKSGQSTLSTSFHGNAVPKGGIPTENQVALDMSDDLNDAQRQAVEHETGPVLVVAGPGTGKTRTLTRRIAFLVSKRGVSPEEILAVTFTNKAAEEMRSRLKTLMRKKAAVPLVGTFHSVCLKILEELDGENLPEILDDKRRKAILRDAVKQVKDSGERVSLTVDDAARQIASAKQQLLEPGDLVEATTADASGSAIRSVYVAYQRILSIEGFCDYEDLIFNVVARFKKNPILLKRYQDRFKYIFVDEYQDLNQGQYRVIRALSPPKKNLFVIGDPDQSIYGFRGSNVAYFKRFIEDYPGAAVIQLTQNYRSSKTILEASHQVIRLRQSVTAHSRVYSEVEGLKSITVLELQSEKAEAVAVGQTIEKLVGGTGFHSVDFGRVDTSEQTESQSFSDVAVFYRTAVQADVFIDVFEKAGIPYQTVSRERLYYSKGILDIMSCLKIIEGSGSYVDLEVVARRMYPGVGKKAIETLKNWGYGNAFPSTEALRHVKRIPVPGMNRKSQQDIFEYVSWLERVTNAVEGFTVDKKILYLFEHTPIRKIISEHPATEASFKRLLKMSKAFDRSVRDFFSAVALHTDTDTYDSRAENVSLMTMHAAKGLEFPVVFIAGCEDGYLPHGRSGTDTDEERRLFYVAMTRAMERLYLTRAKFRRVFGKRVERTLSPFVVDIEQHLRVHETGRAKKEKKENQHQLKLF